VLPGGIVPVPVGLGPSLREGISALQSDPARCLRLVDHAHAATTELFQDAVVRDGLANHGWSATVWGDVRGGIEVESTYGC
jgi:hypothetical protein